MIHVFDSEHISVLDTDLSSPDSLMVLVFRNDLGLGRYYMGKFLFKKPALCEFAKAILSGEVVYRAEDLLGDRFLATRSSVYVSIWILTAVATTDSFALTETEYLDFARKVVDVFCPEEITPAELQE